MGKRKIESSGKNQEVLISIDDLESTTSESQETLAVYLQGIKERKPSGDGSVIQKRLEHSIPCSSESVSNSSGTRSMMDSYTFNYHLEIIWKSISETKRESFDYLDALEFYNFLCKKSIGWKLKKQKEIFSKKYVFVPIVCWDHWRLVIFCHFGQSVNSDTGTRCILLLDSNNMAAHIIGSDLRKFVYDIFQAQGRSESKDDIYRIPLLVPQLTPDWFRSECFAKFCDKLDEEEKPIHEPVLEHGPRKSQRIRTVKVCKRRPRKRVAPHFLILADDSDTSS
ncbi:uncharacterized protein LOC130807986 isoform X3 [Amaranthus tricolor]|uniref:uncharacterized protein LOC130807986 isoform X3 n=1 Tax=Amaranthus tricolor TaxID=29722 RepID=UPI00258A04E3|nr:uncharacterized protein LOC130807986 isoform X3 [Amaranthus tricolor]